MKTWKTLYYKELAHLQGEVDRIRESMRRLEKQIEEAEHVAWLRLARVRGDCYQCGVTATLFSDSRCGKCTRVDPTTGALPKEEDEHDS